MPQGVADRLGQIRGGGYAILVSLQGLDDWSTSLLPRLVSVLKEEIATSAPEGFAHPPPIKHLELL
jgi:hypothetical protein